MKSNIAKGIIGNGLAQISLKVIRVLDQLLLVPFFLTAWGAAYYGEWMTLSIIPSILSFSDFGIGSAAGNSFVLAYTAGNGQQAANIRKSGMTVISLTIFFGLMLTIIVLFICYKLKLFENTLIPAYDAIIAVLMMMIAKLSMFYYHLLESYFRSVRKAALGNFINSGYYAANLLAGFCALCIGCDVVGYALSQLIVSLLFIPFYFYIANSLLDLKEYVGRITLCDIKDITYKGLGYMINMIWQMIYFQGGTLAVRLTLGPESVAVFNTMRTACRSVNQIFNIVNGSVFPELQYEYGIGNMHVVHRLFRTSILVSFLVGIGGAFLLSIFGLDIYNWWTQNTLLVSDEIWYIFIIGVVFNGVWWTCIVAYSVTNNPYDFSIPSTIVAIISVGISYVLSEYLGLLGAVLGIVLFDVIMMFYILPNSSKLFGLTTKDIFSKISEDVMCLTKTVLKKYNY